MKSITVINQSQAFYYKALYSAMGESEEMKLNYITLDKHWNGFNEHSFPRELVIPDHCDSHELRCKRWPGLGFFCPVDMFNLLKKTAPDVLVIHEFSAFNWAGWVYAKLNNVPIVVSTELGLSNRAKFAWHTKVIRTFLKNVCGVIAHSPAAMNSDLKIKGNTLPVQSYHALDTRDISPRSVKGLERDIQLVFLGSLIPRKGLDLLFEALAEAGKAKIGYHLDVIGGGDMEWAKDCAEEAGITNCVTFHGNLTGGDIDEILRKNEVFVLPSRFDTYGAVTQEAASRGLALLISKHAGSKVMVNEELNGYVFDPEDKAKFCELLRNYEDIQHRACLMTESYQVACEYSAHAGAAKILKELDAVMQKE